MERSDEVMAPRIKACRDIEAAFKRAEVGVTPYDPQPACPYCSVSVYMNTGFGGQRNAVAHVHDDGSCEVRLSPLYDIPPGKTTEDVRQEVEIPLLCVLPADTPDLGEEVVQRVRKAMLVE